MSPPVLISVWNQSSRVTHPEAEAMVTAVAAQLARDVAPVWGAVPAVEFVLPGGRASMPDAARCVIEDDSDLEGALGYHYEGSDGVAELRVFAAEIIRGGGGVLDGPGGRSVSVTLSHEILETVGDSAANRWADGPGGVSYALELCDAVQGDAYRREGVLVSNFVYPAFFSPRASGQRLDHLGRLAVPFTMSAGGYQITRGMGDAGTVWAARVDEIVPGVHLRSGPTLSERARLAVIEKHRRFWVRKAAP